MQTVTCNYFKKRGSAIKNTYQSLAIYRSRYLCTVFAGFVSSPLCIGVQRYLSFGQSTTLAQTEIFPNVLDGSCSPEDAVFGFGEITTTIKLIIMKISTDIRGAQRMMHNDIGDPLNFPLAPT